MMLDFTIKPDGGEEYQLTADSRDVVVWEKTSKGRTLTRLLDEKSFVDLYRLAHIAAKRQQLFTGTLEEFEQTCVLDFSGDDADEGADPTPPAP